MATKRRGKSCNWNSDSTALRPNNSVSAASASSGAAGAEAATGTSIGCLTAGCDAAGASGTGAGITATGGVAEAAGDGAGLCHHSHAPAPINPSAATAAMMYEVIFIGATP